jgi:diacylglycerol O-acyltransferase
MPPQRLSALDASFLDVETPSAHMHLGWAALLEPPRGRPAPSFDQMRAQIAHRLAHTPRYRQRLAELPLGLGERMWVDDDGFDVSRHVIRAESSDLAEVVEDAMSTPLERDRPLWELWIADSLDDGRIGLVGKLHHCMVDGIAAVELATLLFDSGGDDETTEGDWRTGPPPSTRALVTAAAAATTRDTLGFARSWLSTVVSPARLVSLGADSLRAATVLARSLKPAPKSPVSGEPISPERHLGTLERELDDLRRVRRRFECTLNDVLLTAVAGGFRRFLGRSGRSPENLRVLVPVNVRPAEDKPGLGNRVSFMLVDLPCQEPDPARRIRLVQEEVTLRKRGGDARATDTLMKAFAWAPGAVRKATARALASPRTFNVTVSSIPGPMDADLKFAGCRLTDAYPIVPLADGHAVAIGMTTVGDSAYFGLYADRQALDADLLAADIDAAIDELVNLSVVHEVVQLVRKPQPEAPKPSDLDRAVQRRNRLRYEYQTVAGTPAELDAYVELHDANVEVNARERWLAWLESDLLGATLDPDDDLEEYRLCPDCSRRFGVREDGTDDMTQYGLGSDPSPRLAAAINRERVRGGEPRLCAHAARPRSAGASAPPRGASSEERRSDPVGAPDRSR